MARPGISLRPAMKAGFDFTAHVRLLCADIVIRLPELSHIDLDQVAISFSQTRNSTQYGLHATLTPMRFEGGASTGIRRGQKYSVQRLFNSEGTEFLYILRFYLPRFMNTDVREKLITILHELWHISPHFNGDLRRHPGRCYAHTGSQQRYDAEMARLADRWLERSPPGSLYEFLHLDFGELQDVHGRVYGIRIPQPKLIPAESSASGRINGC